MALEVIDDINNCMENGWSDGLPVIPPYGSLVDEMLDALGWKNTEVIGEIADQNLQIRAEQLAAAAVMAGCKTEYAPIIRALSKCLVNNNTHLSGCEVTTGGPGMLVIVSGPAVEKYGFAHQENTLGANCRVNATIGRFANMVRLFNGRSGGVLTTHGTLGHPGRISYCIAEQPETVWGAYHTQLGFAEEDSVVSVIAAEAPNSVNNHYGETGESVLLTIADCLAHAGQTSYYWHYGGNLIVISPDHMDLVAAQYTREQASDFIFEKARKSTEELQKLGRIPNNPVPESQVEWGTMRSPLGSKDRMTFIESGAAGGRFSAVIPFWAGIVHGVVSNIIE